MAKKSCLLFVFHVPMTCCGRFEGRPHKTCAQGMSGKIPPADLKNAIEINFFIDTIAIFFTNCDTELFRQNWN